MAGCLARDVPATSSICPQELGGLPARPDAMYRQMFHVKHSAARALSAWPMYPLSLQRPGFPTDSRSDPAYGSRTGLRTRTWRSLLPTTTSRPSSCGATQPYSAHLLVAAPVAAPACDRLSAFSAPAQAHARTTLQSNSHSTTTTEHRPHTYGVLLVRKTSRRSSRPATCHHDPHAPQRWVYPLTAGSGSRSAPAPAVVGLQREN